MIRAALHFLHQELSLQMRLRTEWAVLLLFFLIVLILLPFAVGPEPELLRRLGPGVIWLAALLMVLLALDRLFAADYRDGTLDLLLLSSLPLPLIVVLRLLAHGLMIGGMLLLLLPLAALLFGLSLSILPVLTLSLLLGVPVLLLIGGVMAAVTLAVRRGAGLMLLLLAPFYIPVLIFGAGAAEAAGLNASPALQLLLLAALLALAAPSLPFLIAASLKQAQG